MRPSAPSTRMSVLSPVNGSWGSGAGGTLSAVDVGPSMMVVLALGVAVDGTAPGVARTDEEVLFEFGLSVLGCDPGAGFVAPGVTVVVGIEEVIVVVVTPGGVGAEVVVLVVDPVAVVVVGALPPDPVPTAVVVLVVADVVLAWKVFVIVAVQVTVLAPVVPDALHWVMVVGSPVSCDGGAVTVHVIVPPAPPDALHWVTLWPPGPPLPAWLFPGGVATQAKFAVPGFWHWLIPAAIAAPAGYPVRSFVTVAVQVSVLAPPAAA